MWLQSITFVLFAVLLAGLLGFSSSWNTQAEKPSAYDRGIHVMQAAQQSKQPLLLEFYSDTCLACRSLAPVVHALHDARLKGCIDLVMVNVDNPVNQDVVTLFQVDTIPALFVFDANFEAKRMRKQAIAVDEVSSEYQLLEAIQTARQEARPDLAPCALSPQVPAVPS